MNDDLDEAGMLSEALNGGGNQDPTPTTEPAPSEPTPTPEPSPSQGAARDPDTGQFVSKQTPNEPAPQSEPPSQEPAPSAQPKAGQEPAAQGEDPQMPGMVPSWRLAEVSQRARQAEEQVQQLTDHLRGIQMQLHQRQQQEQPQGQPQLDPWGNPDGFRDAIQGEFQRGLQQVRLENSLARAQDRHGASTFGEAYNALVQSAYAGDRASYLRVMNSPDPGEAIVQWNKERQLINETGGDPKAYREKIAGELKGDPEFRKQLLAELRAEASGNGQTPPNTVTQLPPSLSSLPGGSSPHAGDGQTAFDDAGIFKQAVNSPLR